MPIKDKINTAKDVLSSTRSRMVVVMLAIIVVVVLVVAYVKFKRAEIAPAGRRSVLTGVPGIVSIPGMGDPTREYAKLQELQNIQLAEEAARRGTAALPTVVRTTYLDAGVAADSGVVAGCSIEELKRARAAGVSASELRCRGCSLAALKEAGFTTGELRVAGFSASGLRDAGFSAAELKTAGFSANELSSAGFGFEELSAVGFTAGELKNAGFSDDDLRKAGFSDEDIKALSDKTACDIRKLREARSRGVKAAELRKLGCSASALRDAGYTAKELKEAGFSAGELRRARFSARELKEAGVSASELKDAGFGAKELSEAVFTADELSTAGFTPGDLVRAGVVQEGLSAALVEAGSCSVKNLKKARKSGVSATELRKRGCSASALRAAGFSAAELRAAGFSAAELRAAGFSLKELRAAGFSAAELKAAGFSCKELAKVEFALKDLKDAGCDASELSAVGFSAEALKAAGFPEAVVKEAAIEKVVGREVVDQVFPSLQDSLGRLSEEEMANMSEQEIQDLIGQQQAMMMMQAGQLFSAWTPIPAQQYVQGEMPKPEKEKCEEVSKEKKAAVDLKNADVYKAGSIILAVLDTSINSDESTPVRATVVYGPLKGSKVIGNFRRVEKKILLKFSVIAMPGLDTSMALNAVAIDPNTDRTTFASSVDNHYLMRYGTLFGSAFISGFGQAVQSSGGTLTTTATTGNVVTMPTLTALDKTIVALGNVGQMFGQAMAAKFNTPPTIKVDAGISVGLLLMADLVVPKKQKQV